MNPTALAQLWAVMLATYGHRWESAYGRHPEGVTAATWSVGLADVDPEDVAAAARDCLTFGDGWPPTLPEFRAIALGITSLAQVRADLDREDAHRQPFTRMVWRRIDAWNYRHADANQGERILREAYQLARDDRMAGTPLPETLQSVTYAPAPTEPHQRDEAAIAKTRAEIAKTLGLGGDPEGIAA